MSYYSKDEDISYTPATRAEEVELFAKFYAGDLISRDKIITNHLKLVVKLSLAYARGALPEDEAISAGNAGLIRALEGRSFDTSRGVFFSSYVSAYIRGQVLAAIRDREGSIPAPVEDEESTEENICPDSVDHAYPEIQLSEVRMTKLNEAIDQLPPLEAATVRSTYFDDKSFAEIAHEHGFSREGVRKAHVRAMGRLATALANLRAELC